MPGLDLNEPINWDEIEEFEGGTLDLSYDFVWDSANEEEDGGGNDTEEDDEHATDVEIEAREADVDQAGEAVVVEQTEEADIVGLGETNAGDEAEEAVQAFDSGTPVNIKRRRYYPPDIKRILYAMCLERSAPGMLKEGVTKSVANDMGVPLRVVQRAWHDGQRA
nr:unnamed protein product [Digitaria exilis]